MTRYAVPRIAIPRTSMLRVALAASACVLSGHLATADTGSPPPPVIVIGGVAPPTKAQTNAFFSQVLPSFQLWIAGGNAGSSSYQTFLVFIALYPCSAADRAAYVWLYLSTQTQVAD